MYVNFRTTGARIFFNDMCLYASTLLEELNLAKTGAIINAIYAYFYSC